MHQGKYSLNKRLTAIIAVTIACLATLFTWALYNERALLFADRQEKIRNLVEVAHSVVVRNEQAVRDGRLSTADAQRAALDTLRGMRYDREEYFWVNDMSQRMVMHGAKPELDGKDMTGSKDPNGKLLFADFIKTGENNGSGFVEYDWPKPGKDVPVAKVSYVKGFAPWGWVVGTGIYLDDVEQQFRKAAMHFLLWGILISAISTVPLFLLRRSLIRLLGGEPQLAVDAARRIAAGDINTGIVCKDGDKDSLLAAMQEMQTHLRDMIGEIIKGAIKLEDSTNDLLVAAENVEKRAQLQNEAAAEIAASVEQMTASISQVSESSRDAYSSSIRAGELAGQGTAVIGDTVAEISRLASAVHASSAEIEELGRQSEQISSIVNTIREIADQTNLLALNAAIEAARAGEQGRGFAVVADEVRKLAESTSLATTDISQTVSKIQTGTSDAVSNMETGVAQANNGVVLAKHAGESVDKISESSRHVVQVVNDITLALNEQSSASAGISESIELIARMSEESAVAVKQAAEAARNLKQLSSALHASVNRFNT